MKKSSLYHQITERMRLLRMRRAGYMLVKIGKRNTEVWLDVSEMQFAPIRIVNPDKVYSACQAKVCGKVRMLVDMGTHLTDARYIAQANKRVLSND